jgi:hypothetical protein
MNEKSYIGETKKKFKIRNNPGEIEMKTKTNFSHKWGEYKS